MAERQSAHRESLESSVIIGNLESQKRGSIFAFMLALIVILAGVYLMATGKNAWGFAAILTSLSSLAAVFAFSKSGQKKEREEKLTTLESGRSK